MLYVHDDKAVKITQNKIEINFNNFLKLQENGDFDGLFIDRKEHLLLIIWKYKV